MSMIERTEVWRLLDHELDNAVARAAARFDATIPPDELARQRQQVEHDLRAGAAGFEVPKELTTVLEARHSFVSMMADAGFDLPTIGDFVGHSSTYMTDRYRHLLDGAEEAAAKRFDAYLRRANTHARIAQLEGVPGVESAARR